MSRLEELIQELCPNGVKHVPLKSVCSDFIVPMRDRPKVFNGETPWCRIEDKEGQYFNDSLSGLYVSEQTIKDMTSGYRAVNKKIIKKFSNNYTFEYPEPITNLQIIKSGFKVKEIPVNMNERKYGKSYHYIG